MIGLLRRLGTIPLLFVIVSFGIFLLVDLAPGDVAVEVAGQNATDQDIARVRAELGLNDPLITRYASWLGHAVQGDLGRSLTRKQDVTELITSRLAPTVSLALGAIVLALLIGGGLGILAAVRKGGRIDQLISMFAAAGIALPQFWVGLVLVTMFSLNLGALPATGYVPITESPWQWFTHLILPALALAWMPAAEILRHTRSAAIEVLEKPYVLTARSKGLSSPYIVRRHVVRNAGIPVVTVLGTRIAHLLGGTVVIETVFGIGGLGTLTVQSVLSRDMPVILGVVSLATLVVLIVNFLVDLSYSLIDPRAEVSA